jgi:hypothetical protein
MERFTLPAGFRPGLVAFAALLLLAAPSSATAQERWSSSGPSGHSPIGVMGDHTHSQGEWMAALMYSRLSMSGLKDGAARVSVDEAWMDYQMVPLEMTMDMYMPHLMWAPSDQVTLMAMGMWMDHQMDVRMANHLMAGHGQGGGMGNGHGMEFHEHGHQVSGWSDVEVSALVKVLDRDRRRVHFHLGVGIPTGSVTASDSRMVPEHARLGYPMQLGSGSWEARPGVTFLQQSDRISWGVQGLSALRLNENSEGWKRGAGLVGNVWAMLRGSDWAAPGLRVEARRWGSVSGRDAALDPTISPENDPELQGGKRLDGFLALNLQVPGGRLAGHRLAFEFGGPLFESLDGPQMSHDWGMNVGWEYAF